MNRRSRDLTRAAVDVAGNPSQFFQTCPIPPARYPGE